MSGLGKGAARAGSAAKVIGTSSDVAKAAAKAGEIGSAAKSAATKAAAAAKSTAKAGRLSTGAKIGLGVAGGVAILYGVQYLTQATSGQITKIEQAPNNAERLVISYSLDPSTFGSGGGGRIPKDTPVTISSSDSTPNIDGTHTVIRPLSDTQIEIQGKITKPGTKGSMEILADKSPLGVLKAGKGGVVGEVKDTVSDAAEDVGDIGGETFGAFFRGLGFSSGSIQIFMGLFCCVLCMVMILWLLISLS